MQCVIARLMSRETLREHSLMLLLGSMTAEERLAAFLLNLSERYRALHGRRPIYVLLQLRRGHAAILSLRPGSSTLLEQVNLMASNFDPSTLMNPVALWTDLGLRAIEMAVSSTQSISEGMDRFTRAGASVEAAEGAASSSAVSRRTAAATSSGVALAADLQRSTFDLLTRGWLQWMSALGSVASLAASIAPGGRWMRQSVPLEAMRKALLPAGWADRAGMQPQPGSASRPHEGQRREAHAESGAMEHALASAESKRRRSSGTGRTKAKPKARRSRS